MNLPSLSLEYLCLIFQQQKKSKKWKMLKLLNYIIDSTSGLISKRKYRIGFLSKIIGPKMKVPMSMIFKLLNKKMEEYFAHKILLNRCRSAMI